ncbi:L-amino acid N-acyltransferase YncA [Aquiflexum balticum DSM 16537]|uniref:L-amino acid N-acyltransferase YncA n=1 Tax=Aquiflexum balticum DSM 16537 TaxID=758820 RepID=A0A1W2H6F3_9BACT|nr:GNAT family N-acetyltransferase [Aquiflexum balticum]SMD44515.1 L-amino acid N-acyltransferase YncA [Aquiflexum balticum DSM 16537]
MINIVRASADLLPEIQNIAYQTWPKTFSNILSPEQINYMLNWMYDLKALKTQLQDKNHIFLLAEETGKYLGFASYETNHEGTDKTKIHKIYILPEAQGKGIGKKLIQFVEKAALENGNKMMFLNVNKFNQGAIDFYRRIGFYEAFKEVIDIGNGFIMDDLVMELKLT